MKIHHIGYAVKEIDNAIRKFEALGYTIGNKTDDKLRNVVIAFARNGNNVVELIAPLKAGSPVDSILEKNGATPYHICYEVEDMDQACDALKKDGWVVLRKPEAAPAIEGALVAFLYDKSVGLIELVEITK